MKIKNFLSNILIFGILLSSVPTDSFADIKKEFNQKEVESDKLNAWITSGYAPMPTGRENFASTVIGDKVYCIGGYGSDGYLNTVEVYDLKTNTWETKESMPTKRCDFVSVAIDGKIYCIGGLKFQSFNGSVTTAVRTNIVEIYDPETNTWSVGKSMPTERDDFGGVVVDGKVYCIGGYSPNLKYTNIVEVYDPKTNSWETKTSMPTKRYGLVSVAIDNKIYCIGGYNSTANVLNAVEVYDTITDKWEVKNSMPTARYQLASAVVNEKIYCIGGIGGGIHLDTIELYDPKTDNWETKGSMPTPRSGLASIVVDEKIYCIGGNSWAYSGIIEVYIPEASTDEALAINAITKAEETRNMSDVNEARYLVNRLPESKLKDELQSKLNILFSDTILLNKETATANIDVYIKSENMLSLSLDTNNISFDNYSGVESVEMINAINLTVNSSLPYQVNAYLATEIESASGNIMDKSLLNIKSNEKSDYQKFDNLSTAVQLLDNQPSGNDIIHAIDFKLDGDNAYEADIYKTSIKFEVSQK